MVRGIADAVVMKNQQLFFFTDPDGRVPRQGDHGLGLYYHDYRFLKSHEMQLAGIAPQALGSTAQHGYMAVFVLPADCPAHSAPFIDRLEMSGLCVGTGIADLQFRRTTDATEVQVLRTTGPLEVQIEP
jgi:hypothetical protein